MEIKSAGTVSLPPALSILQSANQQPKLAAELISKTVASILATQTAQTTSQTILPTLSQFKTGSIIDTVA